MLSRRSHAVTLVGQIGGKVANRDSPPIAKPRLYERQRRHCRSVGAQNARTEAQPQHSRAARIFARSTASKPPSGPINKVTPGDPARGERGNGLASGASSSQNTSSRSAGMLSAPRRARAAARLRAAR